MAEVCYFCAEEFTEAQGCSERDDPGGPCETREVVADRVGGIADDVPNESG